MITEIKKLLFSQTSKDSAVSLAGNIGVAVNAMLFTIIIARGLAPDRFGLFSALVALVSLLASLGDMGLSGALVNFIPKLSSPKNLITTAFWSQTAISVFFSLLLILVIPFKNQIFPGASSQQLLITAIMIFVFIIEIFWINLLRAQKHFGLASLLSISDSFIKLTFIALVHPLTIELGLVASLISAIPPTLFGLKHYAHSLSFSFSLSQLKQLFSFVKWLALIHLLSIATGRIDTIFLVSLHSSYAAGIFSAANRMVLLFILFVSSISMVIAPRFSGFTTIVQVKNYLKKISLLLAPVLLLMLILQLFAGQVVDIVFGADYKSAVLVFRYLMLAYIPFLISLLTINPLIYFFNLPKFIAAVTGIQLSILVILDLIFIPQLGALGPVVAVGLAQTVALMLTGYKLWQKLRPTV